MGSVSYSAHISNGKSAITILIHALETDDKGERIQEIEYTTALSERLIKTD